MTRQAIETRTRLLIAKEILERALTTCPPSTVVEPHEQRLWDAYHAIGRAAASLEPLND